MSSFLRLSKLGRKFFSIDYYDILGISKNATKIDIKKSFIKLAKEYHPDKNPNACKDKFKKITEAYQTLIDLKKKDIYDKKGMDNYEQKIYNNQNEFDDFQNFWKTHDNENFDDIYNDFDDFFNFTKSKKSTKTEKGNDVIIELKLEFLESVFGIEKKISFTIEDICDHCKGTKCKNGQSLTKCDNCKGKGSTIKRQGPMQFQQSCQKCEGEGKINKCPCNYCKGKGETFYTKVENIKIPKGIENNQNLRIKNKGNKGINGGENGDLIIKILVEKDNFFIRKDLDIYTEHSLSLAEAVLGTQIDVKFLNNQETVTVKKGTNPGDCIRFVDKGIQIDDSIKGDHWVIFKVKIPENLNSEEIELMKELRDLDLNQTNSEENFKYNYDKVETSIN